MFNKQVWHDRKQQVEVFRNGAGDVIGTIVSFRKGICLINPLPEVLIALYQESKIRRIQSINAILLTDRRPDLVRGLCTFLGYSRQLKRAKNLDVRLMSDDRGAANFLNSCCMQIMKSGSKFTLDLAYLGTGSRYFLGDATIHSVPLHEVSGGSPPPMLEIATAGMTLHYYDERFTEESYRPLTGEKPDVSVRAVQVPQYSQIVDRSLRFHNAT